MMDAGPAEGKPNEDSQVAMAVSRIAPDIVSLHATTDQWQKFDAAMKGISEERKEEISRVMSNLRLRPDDPSAILLVVSGKVEALAEGIQGDFDDMLDQACRDLKSRLSKDFNSIESSIVNRISEMENSAIVVAEVAIAKATEAAAKVSSEEFEKLATAQIESVGQVLEAKLEDVKKNVKSNIDRAISQRVKEESKKAANQASFEIGKMKYFIAGLLLGVMSACMVFAFSVQALSRN